MKKTTRSLPVMCIGILLLQAFGARGGDAMTTAQLLENTSGDRVYATAMYVAGWIAGTHHQLLKQAEFLRSVDADREDVDDVLDLASCVHTEVEVADLWAALRESVAEGSIDADMPASRALGLAVRQRCGVDMKVRVKPSRKFATDRV